MDSKIIKVYFKFRYEPKKVPLWLTIDEHNHIFGYWTYNKKCKTKPPNLSEMGDWSHDSYAPALRAAYYYELFDKVLDELE